MITAQRVVDEFVGLIGRTYGTGPLRLSDNSTYTDCSGGVVIAYRHAGGGDLGAYTSSAQFALCRSQGLVIPFVQASNTPGALLFRPTDPMKGIGAAGHVVMVRSPGITIESRGGYGVGSWPISRLNWSPFAALLPGVAYGEDPHTEEDMGVLIITDGPSQTFFYDGNTKRPVDPGEDQQLKDLGQVPTATPKYIPQARWNKMPNFVLPPTVQQIVSGVVAALPAGQAIDVDSLAAAIVAQLPPQKTSFSGQLQ